MILLDINILIAMADADHVHHSRAKSLFASCNATGWAACPLTENGFVSILVPDYQKRPGSSAKEAKARDLLNRLCALPGHSFWPEEITLREFTSLPAPKHLTDQYLGLPVHRKGKLATLDQRIDAAAAFPGGKAACLVI